MSTPDWEDAGFERVVRPVLTPPPSDTYRIKVGGWEITVVLTRNYTSVFLGGDDDEYGEGLVNGSWAGQLTADFGTEQEACDAAVWLAAVASGRAGGE